MSATSIKVCDLFCGESIRTDNGRQLGMPVFGRFAAIVRNSELRVSQAESGEWYISLPNGCTLGGDWSEAEALDRAVELQQSGGWDSWATGRDVAVAVAIKSASDRHDQHCRESAAYAKKFNVSSK